MVPRNQFVSLAVAVLILGGLVVGGSLAAQENLRQKEEAAAVAAEKEATAEKARAEQLAAEKEAEFQELLETATTRADDATKFHTDSAPWGPVEARATLADLIEALRTAIDDEDETEINQALENVYRGREDVGTLSDAQDRRYDELVTANGKPEKVGKGREFCASEMESTVYEPANPARLADFWLEHSLEAPNVEAIQVYCPELQPSVEVLARSITDGSRLVGKTIRAGTYKTVGAVHDCYWERSDGSGDIYDNNFVGSALNGLSVTVYNGEQFETSGCGIWRLQ